MHKKTVEFCHRFDPNIGRVTVPRSGGSYPSRLTILGDGADALYEQYDNAMSGFDHAPPLVTPTVVEMTRTRDTDWGKAVSLLREIADSAGFRFQEKTPRPA